MQSRNSYAVIACTHISHSSQSCAQGYRKGTDMDNLDLALVIINWAATWSGSDYIQTMARHSYASIPLLRRHELAKLEVKLLEEYDSGAVGRLVGEVDENGWWRYVIGWGGTEVSISPEGGAVVTFHTSQWVEGEGYGMKGQVTIVPTVGEVDWEAVWEVEEEGEHSWGRARDLHELLVRRGVYSKPPKAVLEYRHDPEVGGGF